MSKLSHIIKKQLLNTILSSSASLQSSPVKLIDRTKAPLKIPNFLAPVLNFSRNLTPKQNFLFSHTRVINLSFNSNPRNFCSSSSPHMETVVNQKIPSSKEVTDSTRSREKDHLWVSIPVRAYYKFNRFGINYAVLKFCNGSSQTPSRDSEANLSGSSHSYMVVFPYGSTVTFNMLDGEVDGYLKIIERHASGLAETGKDGASFQNYHIKYEVREKSSFPMWMQGGRGYVMLQHLDMEGIRAISSVLGQSIALDYYFHKVDGAIAAFAELPRGRRTIRSRIMRKKKMYQLVGRANSTLVELVVKLGLFERSEIASMEDGNYSRMLEYLKDQFELNQKIVGIDFYLRVMERFTEFVGADMMWRYILAAHGLIVICAGLVYCFLPLITSLSSLADVIMTKTNTVKVTY
ncbi:hypothetical protein MKW98_009590 [Papaver atlanticum]|uniref:DUF155 domain-containing protein n=1 Tax=Papaver atlanticum TaxID=357466 RepID=A0AAD4SEW1_9MAGN|nr:hypothetical protein MKW98_009590 [Papaver atlanticum]